MNDSEKLDQILSLVQGIATRTAPDAGGAEPAVVDIAAYDRPELNVNEIEHWDAKTPNKDGSIWTVTDGKQGIAAGKYRTDYGYISPIKTPHLWKAAQLLLGDDFVSWEARWKAAPFAIYKADLEGILREGKMPMNFMLFNYLSQSSYTFVQ